MQTKVYEAALAELSAPKLSKFLNDMADFAIDIPDWSKMKVAEKRESLLTELKENEALRGEFRAFYYAETGKDESPESEWEVADLPAVQAEGHPAETPASASELVSAGHASHFVEGAFDQIVSDVAGLNAHDSDKNLREMEDRLEFEHIRMGVLLSHIQASQHYVTLGYDNMREYLAAHTGLHYRKAMFLISNANAIKELGLSSEELKGVSWSALRYIVQVMTPDNATYWLDAARSLTHVALIEEVRQHKAKEAGALPAPNSGDTGEEKPKPQSKMFNLYPDQKQNVEAAIEKAKAEGNVESTGAALDLIAAAYTGKPPTDTSVAAVMPDTSVDGLTKVFSKMKADDPEALFTVLQAIDAVWSDVTIDVSLPETADVAAE